MTTDLKVIDNSFLFANVEVRSATDKNGDAWFCAKDIFNALGIAWKGARGSLMNCPEEWQTLWYIQTSNGGKDTIFISEPAVYQTIFRSNKPEAITFSKWVCEEVLPAIRRQGFYGTITPSQQVALRNQKLKLLEKLSTKDAFLYQSIITSLRSVCNQLGEPMPDLALIGKDRAQLELRHI